LRASDSATVAVADQSLGQERAAAERIAQTWDVALDAAFEQLGV
jgi:hypothetical protein